MFGEKKRKVGHPAAVNIRKAVGVSPLSDNAEREANESSGGLVSQHVDERFTLSLGERAGVRASVGLTCSSNARRELEKKAGRKVVTSGNDLALTQVVKKAKRVA
jgi:hypothetical protein